MSEIKIPSRDETLSRAGVTPQQERDPITPIVKGPVERRKKSLNKRFVEAFVGKDIQDVKGHIINNVVIPTIKWGICEIARSIPEFLFYGRNRPSWGPPSAPWSTTNAPYYNYSRISVIDPPKTNMYGQVISSPQQPVNRNYMFDDIVLSTAGEAEALRVEMVNRITRYGSVSVGEVNEMLRTTVSPVDFDWGWKNLSSANIRQVRGGYLLVLPQITYLK